MGQNKIGISSGDGEKPFDLNANRKANKISGRPRDISGDLNCYFAYLTGQSSKAIAEVYGLSIKTVVKKIARGRKVAALNKQLELAIRDIYGMVHNATTHLGRVLSGEIKATIGQKNKVALAILDRVIDLERKAGQGDSRRSTDELQGADDVAGRELYALGMASARRLIEQEARLKKLEAKAEAGEVQGVVVETVTDRMDE